MRTQLTLLLLGAGLSLSACSKETNIARSFYSEAGSEIETGAFGNATMQNTMVQNGERDYAINLTRKFQGDVTTTVHFAFNSAVLDTEAQSILMRQADWLVKHPTYTAIIQGHADEQGTREYNLALGARRASAVQQFLIANGVSGTRLQTVSYGKERPLAVCSEESCFAKNRRAVTALSVGAGS